MSQENQRDWVARMVKLSDQRGEFKDEFLLLISSITQRTTKYTLEIPSAIFLDFFV